MAELQPPDKMRNVFRPLAAGEGNASTGYENLTCDREVAKEDAKNLDRMRVDVGIFFFASSFVFSCLLVFAVEGNTNGKRKILRFFIYNTHGYRFAFLARQSSKVSLFRSPDRKIFNRRDTQTK
jgi:hypothetical protein